MAVAQVVAKQVAVRRAVRHAEFELAHSSARRMFAPSPTADCRTWDPGELRDPVVAEPLSHELLHLLEFCLRPGHMRTYVRASSGRKEPPAATIAGPPGERANGYTLGLQNRESGFESRLP